MSATARRHFPRGGVTTRQRTPHRVAAGEGFGSPAKGDVSAARAHAALGDVDRAVAAIHRAEDAWERVTPDDLDELGGIATFSRARTIYYAADALAWVPEQADAQRYAEQAVAAYADPADPAWAFGDEAGSHADLAIVRVARRDLDGAADALVPVLDLPAERRIAGIVQSVQRVHRTLAHAEAAGDGVGAEMQDAIEEFTRSASGRALPR